MDELIDKVSDIAVRKIHNAKDGEQIRLDWDVVETLLKKGDNDLSWLDMLVGTILCKTEYLAWVERR